jgi:hypothetical protein
MRPPPPRKIGPHSIHRLTELRPSAAELWLLTGHVQDPERRASQRPEVDSGPGEFRECVGREIRPNPAFCWDLEVKIIHQGKGSISPFQLERTLRCCWFSWLSGIEVDAVEQDSHHMDVWVSGIEPAEVAVAVLAAGRRDTETVHVANHRVVDVKSGTHCRPRVPAWWVSIVR